MANAQGEPVVPPQSSQSTPQAGAGVRFATELELRRNGKLYRDGVIVKDLAGIKLPIKVTAEDEGARALIRTVDRLVNEGGPEVYVTEKSSGGR
jgi:hypothetical protein